MRSTISKAAAIVIAAMLVVMPASAATPAPDGFTYAPSSQQIFMGIGCEGTGVCDSTEYWIGNTAGGSSVGQIGSVTPVNEAFYQAEGEALSSSDFPANAWLYNREFLLRTDEPLTGQITLRGYGNAGFGVNSTVDVVIGGRNLTNNKRPFTLNATATDHHLPGAPLTLEYSIDLDPAMDGDTVVFDNLNLVVRGVNVLTGFVNGQGESYFTVPTHQLVEVAP